MLDSLRIKGKKLKSEMKEEEFTAGITEVQRFIQEYYERVYPTKCDNLEEIGIFLEIYNLFILNHEDWKTDH